MGRRSLLGAAVLPVVPASAMAVDWVEPRFDPALSRAPSPNGGKCVALTLDACPGGFDERLARGLVEREVKTTIFLTARWLRSNPKGLEFLLGHAAWFTLENHGANHVPPLLGGGTLYGLRVAGTLDAVAREIEDGTAAIQKATPARAAVWYRGATGRYSPEAVAKITGMGRKIAGYSLNADAGASLSAAAAAARVERAGHGDVLIGHINQPRRPSGQGLLDGVDVLRRKGFAFVDLTTLDPREPPAGKNIRNRNEPSRVVI